MANELDTAIRNAAEKVAQYIADAAVMTVETSYVQIGASGGADLSQPRLAARTVIKLDGDSSAVVPMRTGPNGGLEVDTVLMAIHQRTVATTTEYRSKILQALLGLLQPPRGR